MDDESILKVVQARIDGKMVVAQHKDYCGRFYHIFYGNWDFENYYYRILEVGESYKDTNNRTIVYEGLNSL